MEEGSFVLGLAYTSNFTVLEISGAAPLFYVRFWSKEGLLRLAAPRTRLHCKFVMADVLCYAMRCLMIPSGGNCIWTKFV